MINKKIYLLLVGCVLSLHLQAQIEKGRFLVGSELDLFGIEYRSSKSKNGNGGSFNPEFHYSMNISPQAAYFFTDNIALGVRLGFLHTSNGQNDLHVRNYYEYRSGMFGRYYLFNGKLLPFLETGLNYIHSRINADFTDSSLGDGYDYKHRQNFISFDAGGGVGIPITDDIILDFSIRYSRSVARSLTEMAREANSRYISNVIGLNLGFSFLL